MAVAVIGTKKCLCVCTSLESPLYSSPCRHILNRILPLRLKEPTENASSGINISIEKILEDCYRVPHKERDNIASLIYTYYDIHMHKPCNTFVQKMLMCFCNNGFPSYPLRCGHCMQATSLGGRTRWGECSC